MIRRELRNEFVLITQHDHALLSGELAERVGNERVSLPSPYGPTVAGVGLHDCGWPLHDDQPTLNAQGLPLHVFETPLPVALKVWTAAVERAVAQHDYSGLLVSLHVLGLSNIANSHEHTPAERFEINKFQHKQVEVQVMLRQRLGMRTDIPLHFGLAKPGTNEVEDQLAFNFNLLTTMDRLSLAVCCSEELFPAIGDFMPRPGASRTPLQLERPAASADGLESVLHVSPWPFSDGHLRIEVPCRRLSRQAFDSPAHFRDAYAASRSDMLRVELIPR